MSKHVLAQMSITGRQSCAARVLTGGEQTESTRRKFKANRGGHAPGHIREPFCEALDGVYSENLAPLAAIEKHLADDEAIIFFNKAQMNKWLKMSGAQRARWLLGQLWNCTDILGGDLCETLDLHRGSTFLAAVRKIRAEQ
jgi:hypothetical protein